MFRYNRQQAKKGKKQNSLHIIDSWESKKNKTKQKGWIY